MYRSFLTASLLSFAPSVLAAGSAHVVNNCGFDVYYASVAQNVHASLQKLPSGGYSESYNKPNVGVSIKIATSLSGPVTQFEFTWGSPNIYYDISHIDGNPFAQFGTSLAPSLAGASGYPTCRTLSCAAGVVPCQDAYNNPDDIRTMVCPDNSDLTFTLCPGGASVNNPPAQSVSSSAVATSPAISVPGKSTPAVPVPIPSTTTKTPVVSQAPPRGTASNTTGSFRPTSFQTSTTTPAAGIPRTSSGQLFVPIISSAAQKPPVRVPTTAADNSTPEITALPNRHTWSWGGWGHFHTHRAHASGFRV